MAAKPTPLVAYQPAPAPDPPPQPGAAGAQLRRGILSEWDISDAASLALLTDACHARDVAERLGVQIKDGGDMIALPGGSMNANPLITASFRHGTNAAACSTVSACSTPIRSAVPAARPSSEAGSGSAPAPKDHAGGGRVVPHRR
jgi:hypothetical protein